MAKNWHTFVLPNGRRLDFSNPDGLYPVNAYQSEVFAQAVVGVAYAMAAERACHLIKAKEICAGNGPAAIALKAIGVGIVEATDINADALAAVKGNAESNRVRLDRIGFEDIRQRVSEGEYDLIAVNPPCAGTSVRPDNSSTAIQTAVDGGEGGIDYFKHAVRLAYGQLKDGGRLVIGLTSTMDVPGALKELDTVFGCYKWYAASGTPHAAPFASLNPEVHAGAIGSPDRGAQEIRNAKATGRSLVWLGNDGNVWRNTWFIVACKINEKLGDWHQDELSRWGELPLKPNGWPDDLVPPAFEAAATRLNLTLQNLALT